jgi:aspartyl-tRNA(Asn)/glutamyl-tRNA(Gln) amidotransferase subunit C
MTLSIKDVEHVAKLARLELTEQDKNKFTNQLANILGYIEKLNEIDTSKVEPMMHSISDENVVRQDTAITSISHDEIMQNAPEKEGNFFKVKKVIE